ncbi:MAG: BON domain-containing protein [Azonexus sp.]|jgi:hyperosmotically inducible protein|nr:BON domain-containing protein [Betaproteobacteria bacterium]MBK8918665.1 BON domain-containing protein [Betaproteobacteria bacterium]MBP6034598.1 BON domain-containing protein [Azonexus sp.]MBP6905138.1 BON domain-containing protein [Azonexus sp.]
MNSRLAARFGFILAAALSLPLATHAADATGSTATEYVKDSVITTKIKAELAEEKLSSLVKINVDTDKKGAVTLSGSAASQAAIDRAVAIAHGVKGVTSVRNHIKVVVDK